MMSKGIAGSLFCGAAAIIGSLVCLGWFVGDQTIVQINPDWPPMQFNTALCFALLGVAGLSTSFLQRRHLLTMCTIASAMAADGMIHAATGIGPWLAEVLVQHQYYLKEDTPGVMAPSTALGFLLCANVIRLITWGNGRRAIAAQGCCAVVLAISGYVLLSYLFGVTTGYTWGDTTGMALKTSLGMGLLAGGLFLRTLDDSGVVNIHGAHYLVIGSPGDSGCISEDFKKFSSQLDAAEKALKR